MCVCACACANEGDGGIQRMQPDKTSRKKMVEMQHTPKLIELQHKQESLNAINPNKKRTMTNRIK